MKHQHKKGFTLVELAIVLVIIGLIVSSVLVGQDLIRAAELRATVRQYDEFQTAVNTFLGKYGQIPGDLDGSKYGLTGGCTGGNGLGDEDGYVEASGGTATNIDGERACFWSNLTTQNKEMITGAYDGHAAGTARLVGTVLPKMKVTEMGWTVYGSSTAGRNYLLTGVVNHATNDDMVTGQPFSPQDAFNIDSKIDDGAPMTGSVVAVDGESTATVPETDPSDTDFIIDETTTVTDDNCGFGDVTPTEYAFIQDARTCNLRFNLNVF